MNQKYFTVAILSALAATHIMAEPLANTPNETTPPKKIEGQTAGGEKQTTIIDQNGNLKIIEVPATNNQMNTTIPATTNMTGNPKEIAPTETPVVPAETPSAPAVPATPRAPAMPAVPATPSAPAMPAVPAVPATPSAPAMPITPGTAPTTLPSGASP